MEANAIVQFCQARELLRETKKRLQDETQETNNARHALSGVLRDSMVRHNVECIEIPGSDCFVRMSTPQPKHPPLKTEDEIRDVIHGVGDAIAGVPTLGIPGTVARFVVERIRVLKTEIQPGEAKLSIVTKAVKHNTVSISTIPNEVQQLTRQYVEASTNARQLRERIRPLRVAHQVNEKKALKALTDPVTIRVQGNEKQTDLRIARSQRKSRANPKALGVRTLLALCYECAEKVSKTQGVFEDEFANELVDAIRRHRLATTSTQPQYYLKVYRLATTKSA